MKIENLKKISTYARIKKMSVQNVYWQAKEGIIKIIAIDGVKFVECK